ncbi:C40 family peptidase [Actinomadura scrupuli]|uniref:C40 family peptidase n=1 Tax=Actinomadura scrupuli TaxID=559629 RepID=UPI003D9593C9
MPSIDDLRALQVRSGLGELQVPHLPQHPAAAPLPAPASVAHLPGAHLPGAAPAAPHASNPQNQQNPPAASLTLDPLKTIDLGGPRALHTARNPRSPHYPRAHRSRHASADLLGSRALNRLHSLHDLHGLRSLHDLQSVEGIRSLRGLHGLHDLHALRALQAVPGLQSGQRRALRLALVQEGVRHRRATLVAKWRTRASRAVRFAYNQRGRPYVFGGTGRRGFDCSGLVQQSWRHAGVRLARVARSQFHTIRTHVPVSRLQPGDLLFFNGLGHVGMYVGRGRFIHSPHTGDHVRVARFASYYRRAFVGATRPAWHPLPRVPTSL